MIKGFKTLIFMILCCCLSGSVFANGKHETSTFSPPPASTTQPSKLVVPDSGQARKPIQSHRDSSQLPYSNPIKPDIKNYLPEAPPELGLRAYRNNLNLVNKEEIQQNINNSIQKSIIASDVQILDSIKYSSNDETQPCQNNPQKNIVESDRLESCNEPSIGIMKSAGGEANMSLMRAQHFLTVDLIRASDSGEKWIKGIGDESFCESCLEFSKESLLKQKENVANRIRRMLLESQIDKMRTNKTRFNILKKDLLISNQNLATQNHFFEDNFFYGAYNCEEEDVEILFNSIDNDATCSEDVYKVFAASLNPDFKDTTPGMAREFAKQAYIDQMTKNSEHEEYPEFDTKEEAVAFKDKAYTWIEGSIQSPEFEKVCNLINKNNTGLGRIETEIYHRWLAATFMGQGAKFDLRREFRDLRGIEPREGKDYSDWYRNKFHAERVILSVTKVDPRFKHIFVDEHQLCNNSDRKGFSLERFLKKAEDQYLLESDKDSKLPNRITLKSIVQLEPLDGHCGKSAEIKIKKILCKQERIEDIYDDKKTKLLFNDDEQDLKKYLACRGRKPEVEGSVVRAGNSSSGRLSRSDFDDFSDVFDDGGSTVVLGKKSNSDARTKIIAGTSFMDETIKTLFAEGRITEKEASVFRSSSELSKRSKNEGFIKESSTLNTSSSSSVYKGKNHKMKNTFIKDDSVVITPKSPVFSHTKRREINKKFVEEKSKKLEKELESQGAKNPKKVLSEAVAAAPGFSKTQLEDFIKNSLPAGTESSKVAELANRIKELEEKIAEQKIKDLEEKNALLAQENKNLKRRGNVEEGKRNPFNGIAGVGAQTSFANAQSAKGGSVDSESESASNLTGASSLASLDRENSNSGSQRSLSTPGFLGSAGVTAFSSRAFNLKVVRDGVTYEVTSKDISVDPVDGSVYVFMNEEKVAVLDLPEEYRSPIEKFISEEKLVKLDEKNEKKLRKPASKSSEAVTEEKPKDLNLYKSLLEEVKL